jgi:hypothetical protein
MLHTTSAQWMWRGVGGDTSYSSVAAVHGSLRDRYIEPIDAMEAYLIMDLEKVGQRGAMSPIGSWDDANSKMGASGGNPNTNHNSARRRPNAPGNSNVWTVQEDNLPSIQSVDDSDDALDSSQGSLATPSSPAI